MRQHQFTAMPRLPLAPRTGTQGDPTRRADGWKWLWTAAAASPPFPGNTVYGDRSNDGPVYDIRAANGTVFKAGGRLDVSGLSSNGVPIDMRGIRCNHVDRPLLSVGESCEKDNTYILIL